MGAMVAAALVFLLATGGIIRLFVSIRGLPATLLRRRVLNRMSEGRDAFDQELVESTPAKSIIKRLNEGPLPMLDRFAARTVKGSALGALIEQAGLKVSVSTIVVLSIGLGFGLSAIFFLLFRAIWALILGALLGLSSPSLVLHYRRKARLKKFEELFPEALDLLSRAIKAGHAFTTALGMVADEGAVPVGQEFRKTFDQQNFGLPLKDALNAMSERVPLLDVRFFVTAVLIQRETGGNLSEILENLAHVVRERFKILRQVRVYTAHGRLTGYVLLALPAALAIALSFINPDHMNLLFKERMGQMMLMAAVVMQIVGYAWIKKVVKIEV